MLHRLLSPLVPSVLALLFAQVSFAATLKHHFPLNTNANDNLGVANLTPQGDSVTFVSSGGAAGGFVRLGGTDDYLVATTASGSALSVLGDYSTFRPFSISVWVRQTASQATSGTIGVIGMTTASTDTNSADTPNYNTGFEICTREATAGLGVRVRARAGGSGDGAGFIATGLNIANGNWHHIVTVFEAGRRRVYVDGALAGSSTTAVSFSASQPIARFSVGAYLRATQIVDDLPGDVDDLQIYDGALTDTEALQLFQNPGLTLNNNLPPPTNNDPLPAGTPLADVVDTMIGVAGGANTGSTVPGPCLPHSSIYPSPDTVTAAAGGYSAGSDTVGFAQLHASGSGSSTMSYGNFLVSPRLGANSTTTEANNASPLVNMIARPYSFRGRLSTPGIDCTVVPTANCAIYQFDFPASSDARLYFDVARKLNSSTGLTSGFTTIDLANGTISGGGTFDGNWNPAPYTVYFYAKLDTAPFSGGTWLNSTSTDGVLSVSTATRQRIGSWVRFDTSTHRTVRMKIAISFQSVAMAQQYLDNEIPDWDIAGLETAAKTRWNNALSVVQAPGISTAEARKLYTALFHSLIQPRNRTGDPADWPATASYWDDQYTLWDTWQTLYPLLDIVSPDSVAAIVNSFGERFARNGKAETAFVQGKDFQVGQGGDEVDRVIADAWIKGIPGIDWSKIWPLLQFNANRRTDDYRNLGFVSVDGSHNGYDSRMASGSSTIAFAHGDWCAALVGAGLGHTAEAQALLARSSNWRNVWDPALTGDGFSGFVHGKFRDGKFNSVTPTATTDFYQGTAWNYSFNLFDRDAMVSLMGGRARFIQRLEFAFAKGSASYLDFSNEVNLQAVPLLARALRPASSAFWADNVRNRFGIYTCPGDEDSGAMSSLYFFLTAGFVPSATEDTYYLHGPRVPRLEFNVGDGKTFTVTAANSGGANLYIQSATLDDVPLTAPVIHHSDVMAGKTLAFVMGPNPTTWGTGGDFAAPSQQQSSMAVDSGWVGALGNPQIAGALSDSPTWGSGNNGADNTAIYAAFPSVTLAQTGSSVTLVSSVTFSGMATTQSAPNARFAWGLFDATGQSDVTGWTGYLAGNDTVDATGKENIWRKDAGNTSAYYASTNATALTSYSLPAPAFLDGAYRLILTLTRNASGALDYQAALVRVADNVVFASFTGSDLTPPTYTFNRVGFRSGDVLDTDRIQISQAQIIVKGIPQPPTVALTSPKPGAVFDAPASLSLSADAAVSNGTISKVEYFANGTKVGEATAAPYTFTWSHVITGTYALTARASSDSGAATLSDAANIQVTNTDNVAPEVALSAPKGVSVFTGTVQLAAAASDVDGVVTKVEFYAGTSKLGEVTHEPFVFNWPVSTPGNYQLSVVATDNDGGTASSSVVNLTVQASPISVTENFDGMGVSSTTPPSGWSIWNSEGGTNATWTDSIPITANGAALSVASMVPAPGPLTVNDAPTANNNNGYNAQGAFQTDRAIATAPTSIAGMAIQYQLSNSSTWVISALQIGYDIRRYTSVATDNELPGYQLFYSLDNGTTWTNVSALNPTLAGAGIQVPNTVGLTTVPPTVVSLGSGWAPGTNLLLRWVDDNAVATSPDQIIGLDNVTITVATASPLDSDGDGIPDDYEVANGLDPHNPADADLDLDGDGLSNRLEYALGTPANSPDNPGAPVIGVGTGANGGRLTITFNRARTELTYSVEASDDGVTWSVIAVNPGAIGQVTVVDAVAATPNRLLRLMVSDGVSTAYSPALGQPGVQDSDVPAAPTWALACLAVLLAVFGLQALTRRSNSAP